MINDIIVAIATSPMKSPISIIRLSGKGCIALVNNLFSKDLEKCEANTINYGYIIDDNQKIDEVLVSVFKENKSYTCEELVEINTHGGIAITKKILGILLSKKARLANPGEFSKRAFLNGRIDLLELEAINDMIEATSQKQVELAIKGLSRQTTQLIEVFKDELVSLIARIEAKIDYPEYDDIDDVENEEFREFLINFRNRINDIIKQSKNASIIKNGIRIAIIGQPNVGKSSLLNAFLEEDRAIVTDVAGTTRDVVEAEYSLNGINLIFLDTAGIRVSDDVVEKIGIEKSYRSIEEADLILLVVSSESDELSLIEKDILNNYVNKVIVVVNKADLINNSSIEGIKVSAMNNDIELLKEAIIEKMDLDIEVNNEALFLNNERHQSLLKMVLDNIDDAINSLELSMPNDIIVSDLEFAYYHLQELLGNNSDDSLLDELFSRFCLGK